MLLLEILATSFVVAFVLNTIRSRDIPVGFRALLIATTYFIATSTTQLFSKAGNNFAKSIPVVLFLGHYSNLFFYFLTSIIGFCLGFTFLYLISTNSPKHLKEKYPGEIMNNPEDVLETNEEGEEEFEVTEVKKKK